MKVDYLTWNTVFFNNVEEILHVDSFRLSHNLVVDVAHCDG